MIPKLIGAILIFTGCGGFGFSMAAFHRAQERSLRQLLSALEYMSCELSYRMTPLPQLCRGAAEITGETVSDVFARLADTMDRQSAADAAECMAQVLENAPDLPQSTTDVLAELGTTLGCFDLPGQLRGLENCQRMARSALEHLSANREQRLRSYQTLGLCAGAALAILFL